MVRQFKNFFLFLYKLFIFVNKVSILNVFVSSVKNRNKNIQYKCEVKIKKLCRINIYEK